MPADMPPQLTRIASRSAIYIKAIVDIRFRPDASTERLIVVS